MSVDVDRRKVTARWNGNKERTYGESAWKRWRLSRPLLIGNSMVGARLATREEAAAMRAKAKAADTSSP